MGLDMYAYRTKQPIPPVDFDEPEEMERIAYWRKHPNLHGWMAQLYDRKGGTDADFNVVPVELTLEDLAELEGTVRARTLPETSGFFFGESTPEDEADDLAFIEKARQSIRDGYRVFYLAWW